MTLQEFMVSVENYFDGFPNQTVADLIADELLYINSNDYQKIFRQLTLTLPATWKPDLKTVIDCIKTLKLNTLECIKKKCPVCETINHTTGVCPVCTYDGGIQDGNPEEYRVFWEGWKSGKLGFDMTNFFNKMKCEVNSKKEEFLS